MKKGDRFKVYNGTDAKGPRLEGIATLVRRGGQGSQPNYWEVEFDDEPGTTYPRFLQSENRVEPDAGGGGRKCSHDDVQKWGEENADLVLEACQESTFGMTQTGFCVKCGAEHYDAEPDVSFRRCESCGERAVFGAEQIVMHLT